MKRMMMIGAVVAALAVPAMAQDVDTLSPEALRTLAQKEGKVTVYSFTSRIARVEKAFEEAYPGIDLIGFDMSSTEMITRLRTEAAAGITNADVVYVSDAPVVLSELLETGLLKNYVPPRIADKLDTAFKSPLLAQRLSTKVLMYNEAAYPNGAPIKNLWDLTTPEWKGKVLIVDPLQRGDYLDLMTEFVLRSDEMAKAYKALFGKPIELDDGVETAGHQFIVDLFENDLVLLASTDDVNAAVGKLGQDQPPVGFTSYSDRRDNEDEGWALQVVSDIVPSNGIVFPALLALTADTKNPAAARLAIDFLMGDDSETGGPGYAPFYVAGDWATRSDIKGHPDAIPLADFKAWRVDPAATEKIRKSVGDLVLQLQ
ncbi:extracellular solute-binding protein [Sinorhizobium medicae]|uniref:ABC transporter substrate-binding protein n=1 Tax=Sinorhizobium medicae TaxID=110321 RepID=UPI0003FC2752|nr:ABC transporter substrate-binding protein [Sinorhizobium medicae]MBO1944699.1 ABC transporter substrate-binding protein [Sinorhizobium medicae]MDX0487739.1 extracellular solute-binding protein [Sinorhizobium medicae]MDX0499513.1 extracellular solute-binding protein [Sinorhizobium medicae]MDX0551919.1 extracellular solute-binding protein [Sinorhizobium medicae]MDX0559242.1 extracellular solute-binding protein [Sinorhizobium medicae]